MNQPQGNEYDYRKVQGFAPVDTIRLADDQFAKLVELLTPGYELSKMYLDKLTAPTEPAPDLTEPVQAQEPEAAKGKGKGKSKADAEPESPRYDP